MKRLRCISFGKFTKVTQNEAIKYLCLMSFMFVLDFNIKLVKKCKMHNFFLFIALFECRQVMIVVFCIVLTNINELIVIFAEFCCWYVDIFMIWYSIYLKIYFYCINIAHDYKESLLSMHYVYFLSKIISVNYFINEYSHSSSKIR